jgi:hypothetical protein
MKLIEKIIILLSLLLLILFGFQFWKYQELLRDQTGIENTTIKGKQELLSKVYKEDDLTLIKDGYKITYLETSDDVLITITKNPFNDYKKLALQYIESFNINCDILNPIILAEKGLQITDEEEKTIGDCNESDSE